MAYFRCGGGSGELKVYTVGSYSGQSSTRSISCTSVPNYKNLTKDNFILEANGANLSPSGANPVVMNHSVLSKSTKPSIQSYTASTGTLKVSGGYLQTSDTGTLTLYEGYTVKAIYVE